MPEFADPQRDNRAAKHPRIGEPVLIHAVLVVIAAILVTQATVLAMLNS